MGFPQTRLTLIQRLADGGSDDDWRSFMADYWSPVCRFALRWGARDLHDAEDVAAETFEILWRNRLLVAWMSRQSARLRSLLCAVTRNILANRHRVVANRQRIWQEILQDHIREAAEADETKVHPFFAVWVEAVLEATLERLAADYHRRDQGDYLRVFYARLCQRLSLAEVSEALGISHSAVDNHYRHARKRFARMLEQTVRRQVANYTPPEQVDEEFAHEWQQLGAFLNDHGGLEKAVRRAFELIDPASSFHARGFARAAERLRQAGQREGRPPAQA